MPVHRTYTSDATKLFCPRRLSINVQARLLGGCSVSLVGHLALCKGEGAKHCCTKADNQGTLALTPKLWIDHANCLMRRSRAVALQLFRTKSPDHLIAEAAAPDRQMKRTLGRARAHLYRHRRSHWRGNFLADRNRMRPARHFRRGLKRQSSILFKPGSPERRCAWTRGCRPRHWRFRLSWPASPARLLRFVMPNLRP